MGDGDNVGKYLRRLSEQGETADEQIRQFSEEMGRWGQWFYDNFPKNEPGRIIYAGGDDFLGVIYNKKFPKDSQESISGIKILEWLKTLNQDWKIGKSDETNSNVTLSVGFVWAAPSVPLRDILQHCREAEQISKKKGRDRVTIRIVFNSGQYVQWTCPWDYLSILDKYEDREGGKNWSHVYNDLAHLKTRRAIDLKLHNKKDNSQVDPEIALKFFNIYFNVNHNQFTGEVIFLRKNRQKIVGNNEDLDLIQWINDLITIGWHLCSNI